MLEVAGNLAAFIVAISVLVAVHEFGHYIVGRWCGMKVLRFSIGFGKPVWTHVGAAPDRTEYCISAVPLGGYVRFLDSREADVRPEELPRAFNHRPIPARILVLLAGPLFNFLFAVFVYWALFVHGELAMRPAVGQVEPGSYAAEAGLAEGDRIIRVGDVDAADWESTLVALLDQLVDDRRVSLELEDPSGDRRTAVIDVGDDVRRLTEPGMLFDGLGFHPWERPAVVGGVTAGGAADRAGLRAGDRILAIDGEPVSSFSALGDVVSARPGMTVDINVERDGHEFIVVATIASEVIEGRTVGRLGVEAIAPPPDLVYQRQYGPVESVGRAMQRTWQAVTFTGNMLGSMVTGDVSIKNISGPINIAQFAGASAQAGLARFIDFLAIVSISLGVLNLIPVPVLDGGQVVYQLIEAAKGSPLSERAQVIGQQVGIVALLLLMSFAFYNDIARILS